MDSVYRRLGSSTYQTRQPPESRRQTVAAFRGGAYNRHGRDNLLKWLLRLAIGNGMTTATTTRVTPVTRPLRRRLRWFGLYADLIKAKLSSLIVTTTVGGYMITSPSSIHWTRLLWTILGTFAAAACASALNQWLELKQDARMLRTRGRPLPGGHINSAHALVVGVVVGAAGVVVLGTFVNALTAALALLTILLYVFVYTPLKQRTPAAVLPGAVVGAIPPMIGCAAASGRLEPLAWVLGAVLFVWQGPHFLALAWLHRDDYRRVGFRVLPQTDVEGVVAGRAALVCSAVLLPVTLLVFVTGAAGWVYATGALALGMWLLASAWRFSRQRTARRARRLFLAGIIYLLLLMGLMAIDRSGARATSARVSDIPTNEADTAPVSTEAGAGPAASVTVLSLQVNRRAIVIANNQHEHDQKWKQIRAR